MTHTRTCTVPAILGLRDWWEERFGHLCHDHDAAYVARSGWLKADLMYIKGTYCAGYRTLAVLTCLLPLISWLWYFDIWQKLGMRNP